MSTPSSPTQTARAIPWLGPSLRFNALRAIAALFALTVLTAAVVAAVPGLADRVDDLASVRLDGANIAHTPGEVLRIFLHNLLIVAVPIAVAGTRYRFGRLGRTACDVVIVAIFARSGLLVGAVLGANGADLLPYLVHLPFEWAAVAVATGAWLLSLRRPLTAVDEFHAIRIAVPLLLAAAVLETYATPR
jgi:uncharacterized membrane protein SpoIIM required for sporulation